MKFRRRSTLLRNLVNDPIALNIRIILRGSNTFDMFYFFAVTQDQYFEVPDDGSTYPTGVPVFLEVTVQDVSTSDWYMMFHPVSNLYKKLLMALIFKSK